MKTYEDLTQKVSDLSGKVFNLYNSLDTKYSNELALVRNLVALAYQILDLYFLTDCVDVEKRDVSLPLKPSVDDLPF